MFVEAHGGTDVQIVRCTQAHVRKVNRTIWQFVSLKIAEDEQLLSSEANRHFLKHQLGKIQWLLW